jgi:pimeloyl-ACP methyl ester carboxylesterase
MRRTDLNGAAIEYDVKGSGEPLLLIHGSVLADAFFPLLKEPLAGDYRVISYHRRGFAGSARATPPFTIGQQAADARALLRDLGISRAHVAGHSYGAVIALQLALDAPDLVASMALLEPPLLALVPSGPAFLQQVATAIRAMYERGDKVGAIDAFLTGVSGPGYREVLDTFLPPGAFDLAIADADTFFEIEEPALLQWSLTAGEAARIRQPVLSVVGAETAPIFRECHELIMRWIPHAQELVVPRASHALQSMNPAAVADGLASFLATCVL